ncbi:MAG: ATP-binding protein [Novosphingobium sp.]
MILAAAMLLGGLALWLVSHEPLVVVAYLTGTVILSLAVRAVPRPRPAALPPVSAAAADWTVTAAAIERPDRAMAITDRGGRLVCANTLFEQWFGLAAAPPRLPLDPPAQGALEQAARAAWRDGEASAAELAGGESRWQVAIRRSGRADDHLVWTIAPLATADPAGDAALAVTGKLGDMLGHAGIQAAVVSPEGVTLAASAALAERVAGDPAADLAGAAFVSFFAQDERDRLFYAREGRGGAPLRLVHLPLADDPLAPADPSLDPSVMLLLEADGGAGDGSAGVAQIEALLARLPLGLAMTDRDGRFLFANKAFLRAAGHGGPNPPTYPADIVVREDKGVVVEAVRRHARGAPAAGEVTIRLRAAPNESVPLSVAGVRGLGEAAVLLSLKDTTEEARLKRQITQATKMQAVGTLAGGVAHDFNNVLTAIIGYCDLMLLRHGPGDSDYDDIQQIKANSNRAASLTRQLLAFSRQQTLRPQVLQVPDVVSEVSQMLRRLLGERIRLDVSHARNLGPVRADPGQLEQVIVNLAVNARDAILAKDEKAGGTLTLRTLAVTAAEVAAMRSDIMPPADYTALVVEDTGGGIPRAIIGKIFEPFFTTKETGKGTGLGLSTVYGIVKQSGGFIFADSQPGKGTRFTLYLPVHRPGAEEVAATPPPTPVPAAANWSGGERVLLVEDEDTVRAVAERALTRAGYVVTAVRDGDEGVDAVRGGEPFDLVVSDVVMPGLDGPAMVRQLRALVPGLPVLFISGYAEEQLRREIDLPDVHFLAKPFSVQQIGEAVGRALRA